MIHFIYHFINWYSLSSLYRLSTYFSLDNDAPKLETTSKSPPTTFHDATMDVDQISNELPSGEENEKAPPCQTSSDKHSKTEKQEGRGSNPKKRAVECRELLAQLRDLTYLCEEEDALTVLRDSLKTNLADLRPHIPADRGLFLERNPHRKVKALKQKPTDVKYAALPPRKKTRRENLAHCKVLSDTVTGKLSSNKKKSLPAKQVPNSHPDDFIPNQQRPMQPATQSNSQLPSTQQGETSTSNTQTYQIHVSTPQPETPLQPVHSPQQNLPTGLLVPDSELHNQTATSTNLGWPKKFPPSMKLYSLQDESRPACPSMQQPASLQDSSTSSVQHGMLNLHNHRVLPSNSYQPVEATSSLKADPPDQPILQPSLGEGKDKKIPTSKMKCFKQPQLPHTQETAKTAQSKSNAQSATSVKSATSTAPFLVLPAKVVQSSMSQQNRGFCAVDRVKQCTSNSFTFLLHHVTTPGEKQPTRELIDAVLRVGDRVHTALTSAVGHPGAMMSFEELQTAIHLVGEGNIRQFPQGILSGDVFSTSIDPPFVSLKQGLLNALLTNTGALLRIRELTVALRKLVDGCFALFDRHSQNKHGFVDGNGYAVNNRICNSTFSDKLPPDICQTKGL